MNVQINFYSTLPRAKILNYFLPYFSLYVNIRDGVIYLIYFQLSSIVKNCILSSNSFLHTCEQIVQFYYFWHDNFKKKVNQKIPLPIFYISQFNRDAFINLTKQRLSLRRRVTGFFKASELFAKVRQIGLTRFIRSSIASVKLFK